MRKVYVDQLPLAIEARLEACDFDWLIAGDLWDKSFWDEMLADWAYYSSRPKFFQEVFDPGEGCIICSPGDIWIVDYCRDLPRLPGTGALESRYGRPAWLKDLEARLDDFDHYCGRFVWWQALEVLVQVDLVSVSVIARHPRWVTCPDLEVLEM